MKRSELKRIKEEREWWDRVGTIFGATLIGWTDCTSAVFGAPLGQCSGAVARKILEMDDELRTLRSLQPGANAAPEDG
jgi:hypothetical protein